MQLSEVLRLAGSRDEGIEELLWRMEPKDCWHDPKVQVQTYLKEVQKLSGSQWNMWKGEVARVWVAQQDPENGGYGRNVALIWR